jgi:oxalate decarboxylase/phosphoglucose isomerase-like protein (cupin superfamily)
MQPYTNTVTSTNTVVREFSSEVDPMSLVWHQDEEDRTIEILEGEGWQLQRDNELPLAFQKGDIIFIPEYQIHRIIKGNTNLKIQITK